MEIDKNELAVNNGKDGKPSYIAVNGKVYDVTESRLWKNGQHMNRHQAGQNLTDELNNAPHGTEVLNKFGQVGALQVSVADEAYPPLPEWMNRFFEAYPFFKRHPHPMVVHFPITFFITCSLFLLIYKTTTFGSGTLKGSTVVLIL